MPKTCLFRGKCRPGKGAAVLTEGGGRGKAFALSEIDTEAAAASPAAVALTCEATTVRAMGRRG